MADSPPIFDTASQFFIPTTFNFTDNDNGNGTTTTKSHLNEQIFMVVAGYLLGSLTGIVVWRLVTKPLLASLGWGRVQP
jgi:hypothetical protein